MKICDIGIVDYADTLDLQLEIRHKRAGGEVRDTLIIVEHPSVVTLGRRSKETDIIDFSYFNGKKIPVINTGRGGEVTCHNPGQVVCYPIIDLRHAGKKDIAGYIDTLEKIVLSSLQELGVNTSRKEGKRGVWVRERKIAFIGIAIKRWITYHGVAINVNNDLEIFSKINPCGDKDIEVTSVERELGEKADTNVFKQILTDNFTKEFAGTTPAVSAL